MYILLMIVHIIACLVLIAVILLQAGKGGGLTEMLGGDSAQSLLGTGAPILLKKATTVCAVVFLVTSLLLGMVTARRGRSLFDKMNFPVKVSAPLSAAPVGEVPLTVEVPVEAKPQGEEIPVEDTSNQ
ncbi:MAG: preprotein translocase subunit SecG [Candidatus Omnitrophota bacterium]